MSSRELALCVFIDAFGWRIAERHPQFLDGILKVRRPLGTIFGYSCTCDPTILTGKLPREHGHFSFFRYAPAESPFRRPEVRLLGLLPKSITRRGRVRNALSRWLGSRLRYTGYFQIYNVPFERLPLFDYTEKRDLYLHDGINGGCPTIFDDLRAARVPFYCSDWRRPEPENLRTLEAAITGSDPPRFAYLYLAAMDAVLHAEGTDSRKVTEKIAGYDRALRRVLEIASERYDQVRLFVFSDHGMTNVVETCDLMARIDRTGLRFGEDYAAVYDSTMARFWFLRPNARERITATLCEERKGTILSGTTLHSWGCDFPDHRYGELFFLMKPGVLLCPSFMGETRLAGMHGFDPTDPDSLAFFGADTTLPEGDAPARLDDLHSLMRKEAGLAGCA
ncbi:MAG: alkaline phosphatase family protein [Capsulimonadales bacterium]|nr:alkaline phosphatase family protein [Capsulimonadales bacterium]